MGKRHRWLRLGILVVSSSLLLCCVVPFAGFDPLLNVLLFRGTSRPVIPTYPSGQQIGHRVEQRPLDETNAITTFQTTDAKAAVIDFYSRNLGPPNGKWRQTTMAHSPPRPEIARTWVYDDYCPSTLVDLTFSPVVVNGSPVAGSTNVEVKVSELACRDQLLVIVMMNLFHWDPR